MAKRYRSWEPDWENSLLLADHSSFSACSEDTSRTHFYPSDIWTVVTSYREPTDNTLYQDRTLLVIVCKKSQPSKNGSKVVQILGSLMEFSPPSPHLHCRSRSPCLFQNFIFHAKCLQFLLPNQLPSGAVFGRRVDIMSMFNWDHSSKCGFPGPELSKFP